MKLTFAIALAAMFAIALIGLTKDMKELTPFYYMGVLILGVLTFAFIVECKNPTKLTDFNN